MKLEKELILPSEIIAMDESMSAFRPQTTSTGGFPNISFIARKPENLGTEFKSSVCPVLGVMMFLELQRGKHGMTGHKHFKDLGATASCTVRVAEGSSHKYVDHIQEVVLGDSWFGSVKAAVGLAQEGFEYILQVKQNHGLCPKNLITEILKDSPGEQKLCYKVPIHQEWMLWQPDTSTTKNQFCTLYLRPMGGLQKMVIHTK